MERIGFIMWLLCFHLAACGSDISAQKVPAVVINSFQGNFTDATQPDWKKQDQLYEVDFFHQQAERTALYNASGKLIMHKKEITEQELPNSVLAAIQSTYAAYKIDDSEKIQKGKEIYYQVELEKNLKEHKAVFDKNGKRATNFPFWD